MLCRGVAAVRLSWPGAYPERAVLQRLLSQESEPALLRALGALGISALTGERLAATLLARIIRQEETRGGWLHQGPCGEKAEGMEFIDIAFLWSINKF